MDSSTAPHICLLVSGPAALHDFKIFIKSLEAWHPSAVLYVFSDSDTDISSVKFKGTLNVRGNALDAYKGLTRSDMEARPGLVYDSLFKDYTYEKAAALEWAFSSAPTTTATGVWFSDADITFLAPLPIIPPYTKLALSPHYIRKGDTLLYGKYNAGFMWFASTEYIADWRTAGKTSRFFEQAALEKVATTAGSSLYEFPPQVNFGWWRMYQASDPPFRIQAKFSIYRPDKSVGLRYDGQPLQSVHTHWNEKTSVTGEFNGWFLTFCRKFSAHKPLAALLKYLN